MSPSQVKNYLLPKYKDQIRADEARKRGKERHNSMSALELIISSYGKGIIERFGEGIFGRVEKEMFTKAKKELRNDVWFVNKVKAEIRKEVEAEIRLELSSEVREQVLKEISEEFNIVLGDNLHIDRELFFGTMERVESRL